MTNEEKALNLLGLAQRAGKLVSGEELVLKEIRAQRATIVFLANDASENTMKKFQDKCNHYRVPCMTQFNQVQLSQAIGRKRMVCGVCDEGFGRKMHKLLTS